MPSDPFAEMVDPFDGMDDEEDPFAILNEIAPSPVAKKLTSRYTKSKGKGSLASQILRNAKKKEVKAAMQSTTAAAAILLARHHEGEPVVDGTHTEEDDEEVGGGGGGGGDEDDDDDDDDEIFFGAVTAKEVSKRVETIKVQGEQNQIIAANQAAALRQQHSKSASVYQDAFAAMAATMGGAAELERDTEGTPTAQRPPAALATQLLVPFSPASTAETQNRSELSAAAVAAVGAPGAGDICLLAKAVDAHHAATTPERLAKTSAPLAGAPTTATSTGAAPTDTTDTPAGLNDSLIDFEAMEAEAAEAADLAAPAGPTGPPPRAVQSAPAAKPKFISRLARPQSKLSSFTASPLRSSVVPVVRTSLAEHVVEHHSRLQSQTAAAAVEGELISFKSPTPTPVKPERAEAPTKPAEGQLISFDSPLPGPAQQRHQEERGAPPANTESAAQANDKSRSVRFAGISSPANSANPAEARDAPDTRVRPSLLAMLAKATKSKETDLRKPLRALNAPATTTAKAATASKSTMGKTTELAALEAQICGSNAATFAAVGSLTTCDVGNASGVNQTAREPSIWSPVKRGASFNDVQNQYY